MIDGQDELVWEELITRGERQVKRFLDLGAGGGAFTELVLETHPGSNGVLVDFSEPMVAAATERLASLRRPVGVRARRPGKSRVGRVPSHDGRYDAVVGALCIHHLPDDRKRTLYSEAHSLLEPGGLFLNWEHVCRERHRRRHDGGVDGRQPDRRRATPPGAAP